MTDPRPRTFEFEGLQIESCVVEEKPLDDGGRAFILQSSFGGRNATNSLTCGPGVTDFDSSISSAQERFAKLFAKELRGISPPIGPAGVGLRFLVAATGGWSAIFWTPVDVDLPFTLVSEEVVQALGFAPTGRVETIVDSVGQRTHVEGFLSTIKYGTLEFKHEIFAFKQSSGPMCIAGQDLVAYMRSLGAEPYYQFVDHEISRLHRDALRSRGNSILLIGPFDKDGRRSLSSLRQLLFERGYRGILLDDFPDAPDQSLDQKLMFLASLCRFVICVDMTAAGHYLELAICARFNLVTAVLTSEAYSGKLSTAMLYDLKLRNRYLRVFACTNDKMSTELDEIISWANETAEGKAADYNSIYEWRSRS